MLPSCHARFFKPQVCHALWMSLLFFGLILALQPVQAADESRQYQLAGGSLSEVLSRFAGQAGVALSFDATQLSGLESSGLSGAFSVDQGFDRLLSSTAYEAVKTGDRSYVLRLRPQSNNETVLPTMRVEGQAGQGPSGYLGGELPGDYAGGQVAKGGSLGILGNQNNLDSPFSVTGYTSATIQNQQARTLADVMANDPSVRDFYSQSFPQDAFFIRGFQVDDIAMNGLYGVSPLLRTSPAAFERVEVLKGPSALLNGTPPFGGVGGAVNLIPKRAQSEDITQVTGSFASASQFGTHVDIGRRMADDRLGVRVNGIYRDGETSLKDNEQQLGEIILGMDYQGSSVRVSLDLGYQKQNEQGIENGLFLDAGESVPDVPDASDRIFQSWLNLRTEDIFGTLQGEVDVSENTVLFASVGGRRNDLEELYAYGYPVASNGDFTENVGNHSGYNHTATWQLGVRSELMTGDIRHNVTATLGSVSQERGNIFVFGAPDGVDPIDSNIYSPNFIAEPSLASLPSHIPKESLLEMRSVALADVLSLSDDKLKIVLGARLQQVKQTHYDSTTGDVTVESDDKKLSPAFGVVYKPVEHWSLYGNYIQGFSPAPSYAANANQLLPPAVSKQLEVGAKADFGSIGYSVSLFSISQPNVVFDAGSGEWEMDGEQRNNGIELSAFGEPSTGLRVLAGAMLLDGKLEKTQDGVDDGNTALNAPDLNLNAGVEWDTSFMQGLTLTARGIYTAEQYVDTGNTETIPAWTRLDIGARYSLTANGYPVVLRFAVENVADISYWANSSLYRGAPRTYLASATIDF